MKNKKGFTTLFHRQGRTMSPRHGTVIVSLGKFSSGRKRHDIRKGRQRF